MMRHARGQGTVELGLGALIIVTVLLFGIHFSEVLFISLKVQEAATAAQWEATARKVHSLPGDFSMAGSAVFQAGVDTQARYQDFDGRSSAQGASTFTQVFTNASNMKVSCALNPQQRPFPNKLPARLADVYKDSGEVTCTGSADIRAMRLPIAFLEGTDGFFKEKHLHRDSYHACAFGSAFGATCASAPPVILDDWGLSGPDESSECTLLEGCDNTNYKESVRKVYNAGGAAKGDAAMQLVAAVVGNVPIDPNHFWFSFRGEESNFIECVPFGDGPNQWQTSPGLGSPIEEYDLAYKMRGQCALGRACVP
jgi:hypothetical protein